MNSQSTLQHIFPVSITGMGVYAATGDMPFALYGAVATRISSRLPVPGLSISGPGQEADQPHYAPIADLPEGLQSSARLSVMAQNALSQACTSLPENMTGLRILVLTLLSESSSKKLEAQNPDSSELENDLRSCHPGLAFASFRFIPADTGATLCLATCMEELSRGQWDLVMFGGVDSLIDIKTVQALAARRDCCSTSYPDGTLPGEGAAYLVLEKHDPAAPGMAVITGLGHGLEENHGQAADCIMKALAASIEQALGHVQCTPDRVETVVLPSGNDMLSALEWHQVLRKLWPMPVEPDKSRSSAEELKPQLTIGDTGAAAFPLSLALGCARYEFDFAPVERILVCEAGQGPARGAVFLEKS